MDTLSNKWDESYKRKENFLFFPEEEVIRFFAKNIVKRTGIDQFETVHKLGRNAKVLDLGCGIGRHIVFSHQYQCEVYGVDLSIEAIQFARKWATSSGVVDAEARIQQSDISNMPFANDMFDFVISHGVLDSMYLSICEKAVREVHRVLRPGGLFYCDLISGDDSRHFREFSGEQQVEAQHEKGTIQLYFNYGLINKVFSAFSIKECILQRRENVIANGYESRYHLVVQK